MLTTEYNIEGNENVTIALVSDLHEHPAGPVLRILKKARPDVIAFPGDLMERFQTGENLDLYDQSLFSRFLCSFMNLLDTLAGGQQRRNMDTKKEYSYEFLRQANKIAPVVLSLGNHEVHLTEEDMEVINDTGTIFLNNNMARIKGVLFGGIPSKQTTGKIDFAFLERFRKEPGYKVLLCHHPEYYPEISQYADLILSGHCHGGQIRILGRGLFGPGQGILPKYHHGLYDGSENSHRTFFLHTKAHSENCHWPFFLHDKAHSENCHQQVSELTKAKLVVSAGCSNTVRIPRWGNPEEVVILKIRKNIKQKKNHTQR